MDIAAQTEKDGKEKMLMVQMAGGMGNQMFAYALYKALQEAGKDVYMDDFTHYGEIGRYDNHLEKIFPLSYQKGTRAAYNDLTDSSLLLWHRVRRKLFGRKEKVYQEKDALTFEEAVFAQKDACLVGYWQSERYFESVKEKLRQEFVFDWAHFPKEALCLRERMERTNAVSLHVRRGDYLSGKFAPIYGGICTQAYYESAKRYMAEKLGDCVFYLFTNDADWGRAAEGENVVFVDCAGEDNAYVDMALMSSCRHHILANSSFSWWGAWLNPRQDKIVAAPDKWLNTSEGTDVYYGLCTVRINGEGEVTREGL